MNIVFIPREKSSFRVGRSPDNDFVLNEPIVSRHHFIIFREYGGFAGRLVVMGANGLTVNGRKMGMKKSAYLREGDYITLCGRIFVYCAPNYKDEIYIRKADITKGSAREAAGPVEVEGPPSRKAPEKPSLVLAAGPALTMAIPILLGCTRTVAVLSSVIAAFWAVGNVLARNRKLKREEAKRKLLYLRYLEEKKAELAKRLEENRGRLLEEYPHITGYFETAKGRRRIWNTPDEDDNPRLIRVGLGRKNPDFELNIPKERLDIIDDSLKGMPAAIREEMFFLENVPILEDPDNQIPFGFDISRSREREIANAFIMIMAVNYSPDDLVIVINEGDEGKNRGMTVIEEKFPFVGILPHYAGNRNVGDILRDGEEKRCLVISTPEGYSKFTESATGEKSRNNRQITYVITSTSSDSFPLEIKGVDKNVSYDSLPGEAAYGFALFLGSLWNRNGICNFRLPDMVEFGKTAICDNGGECTVRDVTKSIRFPIGINEEGEVTYLDLHERGDGPHGLIAGTTGSGKSELITTIILSAAIIYRPEELCFFIIDYKGGGTSNLFSSLPHLAGVMTNLSDTALRRVVISLKSENLRRQRLFAEAGVNNIGEYIGAFRRGKCREALPHVVIIVDEFAELKKERPEFMDSLISIAQIGRSLGLHLILSTQKPAGVVDEKIRSNTKFKIALRVEEKADSSDVLGIADAANITVCGRAIIKRAGNKKYECFQSAYTMGIAATDGRTKTEVYLDPFLKRPAFIGSEEAPGEESAGIAAGERTDEALEVWPEEITWFDYFMKRICERELSEGSEPVRPLWLPPLPGEIAARAGEFAVADNPFCHSYDMIFYDPAKDGNIAVIGEYGAKAEKTVMAILSGVCAYKEGLSVYICDFSDGAFRKFGNLDICGGVVTIEESQNASMMLKFIHEMLTERRKSVEFGLLNHGTVAFTIVNFGEFCRSCDDSVFALMEDILRYGRDFGIYSILSAYDVSPRDLPQRLFDLIDMVLVLGNMENFKASMIMKCSPGEIPQISRLPGRGMLRRPEGILEFQTVTVKEEDALRVIGEKRALIEAKSLPGQRAVPYPFIPQEVNIDKLLERAVREHPPRGSNFEIGGIPIGYIRENAKLFILPLDAVKCILVNGSTPNRRKSFVNNLSIVLARYEIKHYFADSYETFISILNSEKKDTRTVILTREMTTILKDYYSKERGAEEKEEFEMLFDNSLPRRNRVTIIAATDEKIRTDFSHKEIYESIMKKPYGITVGGDVLSQRLFDYSYIPYSGARTKDDDNLAVVKRYDNRLYYGEIIVPEEITGDVDNSERRINRG